MTQVANGISCFLVIVWSGEPCSSIHYELELLITNTVLSAIRIYGLNVCGIDRRLPTLVASIGLFQFAVAVVCESPTLAEPTLNRRP